MIEVFLVDKETNVPQVDAHPQFLDFRLRDSHAMSAFARVEISDENLVAPIVLDLAGRSAVGSYELLQQAKKEARELYDQREDGLRLLDLLIAWTRRYPEATWYVSGGDSALYAGRFVARAIRPKFSSRSLSVDPFARDVVYLADAERMDDVEHLGFEPIEALAAGDISGSKLLQREVRMPGRGHSSKGRTRKKSGSGGATYLEMPAPSLKAKPPKKVLTVRVDSETKSALAAAPDGFTRDVLAAVALAVESGRPYEQILTELRAKAS